MLSPQIWSQTADLSDDSEDRMQVCTADLRQFGAHPTVSGTIRTVLCHNDSVLLKELVATDGTGSVLVVDGGGARERAIFGEKTARTAIDNGWLGAIINGVLRDSVALAALPISIKALGTVPRRAQQAGTGQVDVPVQFGGVLFRPGERIWSDHDGVVTSPLTP